MKRKFISLVLSLLLLVSLPGICLAEQTFLITATELMTLEQNSTILRNKIQNLESILIQSQQDLTVTQQKLEEYQKELDQYQADLEKLQNQLMTLKVESTLAKENLAASNQSLTKTKEYLKQYEAAVQTKIKKLTLERNGLILYLLIQAFSKR